MVAKYVQMFGIFICAQRIDRSTWSFPLDDLQDNGGSPHFMTPEGSQFRCLLASLKCWRWQVSVVSQICFTCSRPETRRGKRRFYKQVLSIASGQWLLRDFLFLRVFHAVASSAAAGNLPYSTDFSDTHNTYREYNWPIRCFSRQLGSLNFNIHRPVGTLFNLLQCFLLKI